MKKKLPPKLKRKARELGKPLYVRAKALKHLTKMNTLRAEHLAVQAAVQRKGEYDRITSHLNSNMSPGMRQELMSLRSKV